MTHRLTLTALGATLVALGSSSLLVAPAPAAGATAKSTRQVVLLQGHVARTRPSLSARRVGYVPARRPLTRVRTVLPVIGRPIVRGGRSWVHVRLPGRPSGHTGWMRAGQTRPASTEWHLSLKLSSRRLTVRRSGRVIRRFRVIVGTRATPTPRGPFFIEEALSLSPRASGGPYALATSARSNVLQEFAGGPGQIALHGTNNLSGRLGTAASHGCVRLSPRAITWLAQRVGGGTPLRVTR